MIAKTEPKTESKEKVVEVVEPKEEVKVVDPKEEAKEKLAELSKSYGKYRAGNHKATLSKDGMSITVTENGNDIENIFTLNNALGIPSSVAEKMKKTRAIDGMQSQNCGVYTVTWTYHPDTGLNVIYEINP